MNQPNKAEPEVEDPDPSDDSGETNAEPRLRIGQFCLRAGGRELLHNAAVDFAPSEITLIIGCSGVGKSLLLRTIAGLIESQPGVVEFEGQVSFSESSASTTSADHPVAVVFQNFALFDELSPINNVRIALDHCGRKSDQGNTVVAEALVTSWAFPPIDTPPF